MKAFRRLASLFVATTMVFSMMAGTVAWAADTATATVTISNTPSITGAILSGTDFELYKLFDVTVTAGATANSYEYTVAEDFKAFFIEKVTDYTFPEASAEWNKNDNDKARDYIESFDASGATNDMQDLATLIRTWVTTNDISATKTTEVMSGSATEEAEAVVDFGYYFIMDTEKGDSSNVVSAGMLYSVTHDMEISVKASAPEVNKEVWHDDGNHDEGTGKWDTVADNQIGDTVYYCITSTIPTNVMGYDTYTYTLSDTLSDGIDSNDDVVLYYTSKPGGDGQPGTTHMLDKKYYAVEYDDDTYTFVVTVDILDMATDSEPGVSGATTLYTYYTGVVNENAVTSTDAETNAVTLTYSNNPYDDTSFGTDDSIIYEYTFDLDITKTDEDDNPLAGAVFGLYDGSDKQIYLAELQDDNGASYTPPVYYLSTTETASDTAGGYAGVITTDDTGLFNIKGLDDETTYILKEIAAPDGYNAIDPISFKIHVEYTKDGKVDSISTHDANHSITADESGLSATIVNNSGAKLPSTGGMGNTVFRVIGGAVMLAAAILLVFRRKQKNQ